MLRKKIFQFWEAEPWSWQFQDGSETLHTPFIFWKQKQQYNKIIIVDAVKTCIKSAIKYLLENYVLFANTCADMIFNMQYVNTRVRKASSHNFEVNELLKWVFILFVSITKVLHAQFCLLLAKKV